MKLAMAKVMVLSDRHRKPHPGKAKPRPPCRDLANNAAVGRFDGGVAPHDRVVAVRDLAAGAVAAAAVAEAKG